MLVQGKCNFITNALQLRLFGTNYVVFDIYDFFMHTLILAKTEPSFVAQSLYVSYYIQQQCPINPYWIVQGLITLLNVERI